MAAIEYKVSRAFRADLGGVVEEYQYLVDQSPDAALMDSDIPQLGDQSTSVFPLTCGIPMVGRCTSVEAEVHDPGPGTMSLVRATFFTPRPYVEWRMASISEPIYVAYESTGTQLIDGGRGTSTQRGMAELRVTTWDTSPHHLLIGANTYHVNADPMYFMDDPGDWLFIGADIDSPTSLATSAHALYRITYRLLYGSGRARGGTWQRGQEYLWYPRTSDGVPDTTGTPVSARIYESTQMHDLLDMLGVWILMEDFLFPGSTRA